MPLQTPRGSEAQAYVASPLQARMADRAQIQLVRSITPKTESAVKAIGGSRNIPHGLWEFAAAASEGFPVLRQPITVPGSPTATDSLAAAYQGDAGPSAAWISDGDVPAGQTSISTVNPRAVGYSTKDPPSGGYADQVWEISAAPPSSGAGYRYGAIAIDPAAAGQYYLRLGHDYGGTPPPTGDLRRRLMETIDRETGSISRVQSHSTAGVVPKAAAVDGNNLWAVWETLNSVGLQVDRLELFGGGPTFSQAESYAFSIGFHTRAQAVAAADDFAFVLGTRDPHKSTSKSQLLAYEVGSVTSIGPIDNVDLVGPALDPEPTFAFDVACNEAGTKVAVVQFRRVTMYSWNGAAFSIDWHFDPDPAVGESGLLSGAFLSGAGALVLGTQVWVEALAELGGYTDALPYPPGGEKLFIGLDANGERAWSY